MKTVYQVLLQGGKHSGKIIAMTGEAFSRGSLDMMDDREEPDIIKWESRHVPFEEPVYTRSTYRKPYIVSQCPLEMRRQYELVWFIFIEEKK